MNNILYFDINSGISGDMTIAALLDLGLDQDRFRAELAKLELEGYELEVKKLQKNGITGTDFKVILAHEQERQPGTDHHSHPGSKSRNFRDIKDLIEASSLTEEVKSLGKEIFHKVAEAEAKVHDKEIDEVHFHEVGAVDSIVDIVGTAILINMLEVDHIYASPVPLGTGFVSSQHGQIPVPAPATLEILKDTPLYSTGIRSELVTPTGAAIIKTLAEDFIDLPEVKIESIGYGAGKKDLEVTNMLRVYQAKKKLKISY